jgi:hypothetical protein
MTRRKRQTFCITSPRRFPGLWDTFEVRWKLPSDSCGRPATGSRSRELRRHYRHSEPSAITWLGWHHCPRWHSTGGCPELQLHVHAVGWPTAQAGIMCLCLAWATPMDMAIASSATEQVFSMSRPPCAAKTVLYRAEKFLGNRSRAPQYLAPVKQVEYSTGFP